jgi:hypothetical protein
MSRKVTIKKLCKYVTEFGKAAVVGVAEEPTDCPIARMVVTEHDHILEASVDGAELQYMTVDGDEYTEPLPKWAKDFVMYIDRVIERASHTVEVEEEVYDWYEEVWTPQLILDYNIYADEAHEVLNKVTKGKC